MWTRSLTRAVSHTFRLSTGDSAGAPGLYRVDADTSPFGSEDATPGSRRVCVRVLFLGGPASRVRFGAPHLFLWPVLVGSFFVRPLPGLGCPVCCCFGFFFSSLAAPLLSLAFRVFRPRVPWAWASCGPPPPPLYFFSAPLSLAFGGSRPGVPWALAFCGPPAWPSSLLVFFPFLLLSSPLLFFVFSVFFLFVSCVFLFVLWFFLSFFRFCLFLCVFVFCPSCPGVPVVRFSGWFVCPGLWGVLVCVAVSLGAPWLCPFCVCCCLSHCGVVVCFVFCLVLCGVPVLGLFLSPRCCPLLLSRGPLLWPVVVFSPGVRPLVRCAAVVPCCVFRAGLCRMVLPVIVGCLLLSLVACRRFPLACVVAGAPAWPRGLLPCCVLWFVVVSRSLVRCPVFCGALLPCGAVLWRPAVCFPLLLVLVCVFSLCVRCCVALRVVLFGAGLVCAVVGALCCGVSLCVVVSPTYDFVGHSAAKTAFTLPHWI